MNFEKKDLLTYYQTVRQTIQGFDTLINTILTTGGTVIVAILAAPFAIFKSKADMEWSIAFSISIFAVLAALYVITAIALYADLLQKAVIVGKKLETEIFGERELETKLTTFLDENPLAGGRHGTPLYLSMACFLYLVVAMGSMYYLSGWEARPFHLWLWPLWLLLCFIFWCRFNYRNKTFMIDRAHAWSMFKKVFTCSK